MDTGSTAHWCCGQQFKIYSVTGEVAFLFLHGRKAI